jgi:N-acetylmuramoyl-L-alanine amidase
MTRDDLLQIVHARPEADIVAATIWAEARGDGVRGMAAVAAVIGNRRRNTPPRYGAGWVGVCLRRWQFSCWNIYDDGRRDLNLDLILNGPDGARWHQAQALAELIMADLLRDPTEGATHYHTPAVSPRWKDSPQMRFLRQIGDHVFYYEVW